MSLKSIREELADTDGLSASTQSVWLDRQINRAAKELHDEYYLYLAEREQVVKLDDDQQCITLPHYVDTLVACRRYQTRDKIDIESMRPRYRSDRWAEPFLGRPYNRFRFLQREALKRSYTNTAPFMVALSADAAADIVLTLVGETENAAKVTDTCTVVAGSRTASFTKSFRKVFEFTKAAVSTEDVTLKDVEGNILAVLPNNLTRVSYPVYQVLERTETHGTDQSFFEVLYKLKFEPLVNDNDTFLDESYDNALYHKVQEYIYEKQEGKDNQRVLASQKCAASIENINQQYISNPESVVHYPEGKGTLLHRAVKVGGLWK